MTECNARRGRQTCFPLRRILAKAVKHMAKVITFYVPTRFQRKVKWVAPQKRGKLIEFRMQIKKSA